MVGGDVNPYPIILLVNYWEIRPSLMGTRLDDLLKKGISQIATFVPWQAVESDISHSLIRFLQAVSERRMSLHLILSPEVGVHYPNSGLPKDVVSKKENTAQHCQSGPVPVNLPPNSFNLPSFFAPEFHKRYSNFLGRMDGFFYDLSKNQPSLLKGVSVVLTGSFWKYYRSPLASSQSSFGGSAGDSSTNAAVAYRQKLELFYSQKEFMDPTPASANRWKTRLMEEMNLRWFHQQSEDVFRNRSMQLVQKKQSDLKIFEFELFTPEADPSLAYSNFLQMVSGTHADFSKLSSLIDESATRGSSVQNSRGFSYIHWTTMGGFRMLAEPEKQFLILKSLLLLGGQGGGVIIDEAEWFNFSPQFRTRAEALARSLNQKEFEMRNRALYLVPHIWSSYGTSWDVLSHRLGGGVKMVSSLDALVQEKYSQLVFVDPSVIFTQETIQKLMAWAKGGRVVVLPKSLLYTEAAKIELEQGLAETKRIEVDLGLTYSLHALGEGKLVVYEASAQLSLKDEPVSSWQSFLNAVLSISEIESFCRLSDSRVSYIPLEKKKEGYALFVMNSTRKAVTADIIFNSDVQIHDLGEILSEKSLEKSEAENKPTPANRFTLEVPPFGVLPLSIEGLNWVELRERQLAALEAEKTRENAQKAAESELPGLDLGESLEELWS